MASQETAPNTAPMTRIQYAALRSAVANNAIYATLLDPDMEGRVPMETIVTNMNAALVAEGFPEAHSPYDDAEETMLRLRAKGLRAPMIGHTFFLQKGTECIPRPPEAPAQEA